MIESYRTTETVLHIEMTDSTVSDDLPPEAMNNKLAGFLHAVARHLRSQAREVSDLKVTYRNDGRWVALIYFVAEQPKIV